MWYSRRLSRDVWFFQSYFYLGLNRVDFEKKKRKKKTTPFDSVKLEKKRISRDDLILD